MSVSEISVEELSARLEETSADQIRLVDVRETDEYLSGHVPGALVAPLSSLPDHVGLFADDAVTYVICQAGGRSMRACEYLSSLGKQVVNVAGGTGAWIASGREVVLGESPR